MEGPIVMKLKNFKTAKDLFQKTYNKKMFDFMDFGEISRMKKVVQVKQTKQVEDKLMTDKELVKAGWSYCEGCDDWFLDNEDCECEQ